MLTKIKNYIPPEISNWWFAVSFITIFLGIIVLKFNLSSTLNIIFLFLIAISLILYKMNVKFSHILHYISFWFAFTMISLVSIAYIAALTKEFSITVITLISSSLLMVIFPLSLHLRNLWKMKNTGKNTIVSVAIISLTYAIIALLLIVLFSPLYNLSGIFQGSGVIKMSDHSKLVNKFDFFYFSSLVFYSTIFGDFDATGYSRILVIVELLISFVIHIIVLGVVISSFSSNIEKKE